MKNEGHTSTHSHEDNLRNMLNKRQVIEDYNQYIFKLKSKQNETYCLISHKDEEVKLYFKKSREWKHKIENSCYLGLPWWSSG